MVEKRLRSGGPREISKNQAYFNLKQAAEYLGIGYSTALRDWPSWRKFGAGHIPYGKVRKWRRVDLDTMMAKRMDIHD